MLTKLPRDKLLTGTRYFTTKRSLAIGVMATGGATGGIIFPVIAQQLLPRVGFGWTVRVMGFVILFDAIVFLAIARPRLPPRKTGPLVEWSAFKEPAFSFFCGGMFFTFWALFFAYFYISSFGRDIIKLDRSTSLNVLLVLNAVGVPARILCNLTADKLGPVNTLIPAVFATAVLMLCWIAIHSLGGLYAFCVIYGQFRVVAWHVSKRASLTEKRLLRWRHSKPFSSSLRELDHGSKENGRADRHVLFFCVNCLFDWATHRRGLDSAR